MIVRSGCSTCFQTYNLLIQVSDLELVKQVSTDDGRSCPCPRKCGGEINLIGEPLISPEKFQLREAIELTGLQLFQAIGGMGLPDEVPKSAAVIDSILRANKVMGVDLDEVDGIFYLNELRLDGGIVLHMTAGARGARVLKITKERPNGPVNPG
jgi:hypothetical protein